MKKTYKQPAALVVRVATESLLGTISNINEYRGTGTLGEQATTRGLVHRMYDIEVE